jgi:chromosome segregation ATPase
MIASQKTHIDELVQKTRTLDNTIKSLQEQLSNSRAEWQAERKEWVDGCDSLLACYRIAHLRSNVLLAQERVALAHERDITRRERVAVIQRDYNLILFKAREKEIELEADRLKEELRGTANGNVALVVELREKLAKGMRELKEKAALLRDAEKAREAAEVRGSTLPPYTCIYSCFFFLQEQTTRVRTEHAALQAQISSARTNVDRLTLRLEDAQTVIGEKERLNGELQQEKATLKSQVEKWKSLDDRGGAEVEELHKQRATLESQIKRLESRLAEEQNKVSAHEKAIQKEHKKIEKLQQALEEQAVRPCVEFLNMTSLRRASRIAYC